MPKEFYTEKDIEDMVKRGILTLEVNDNVVLTELAYERASRLGMKLVRETPDNPPSAPVRPYVSQKQPAARPAAAAFNPVPPAAARPAANGGSPAAGANGVDLHQRIRNAVIARMGSQIDTNLLDVIIKRVLASTGVK
ncbi:MAG TPA: hypothetical protein VFF68_14515 [Anaerolineaceae bacterium]|nr:hypothetical protein [Anaerolineaceae bacterium]